MSATNAIHIEARSGGPFGTVSYWLSDPVSGAWAMVDPVHEADTLWEDSLRAATAPPVAILLTHGHIDHVGGVAAMRRLYPDTPVWIHPDGRLLVESGEANGADRCGIPYEPSSATHFWQEGQTIELGAARLRVIEAPGHCPGSVMLMCGEDLIAGDVLFSGSVGRWDLPGGDYDTLARSIREKAMTLPDATRVWPGHGPGTTIGAERRGNFIVREMLAGRRVD